MNNEALTDLRLIKSYVNDMIVAINEGLTINKSDVEKLNALYEHTIDVKNKIIYGDSLPF